MLGDAMKGLALRARGKDLEVACHVHPDVPEFLTGDPLRLRQIVNNLVGNAIKFTQRGEVVLQVAERASTDGLPVLHFCVQDTGIGIPVEKQQAIFDAFSQADASTTRRFGGTGLGLTIASKLVGLMGGRLWVESELGRGSKFHFTVALELCGQADGACRLDRIAGRTARADRRRQRDKSAHPPRDGRKLADAADGGPRRPSALAELLRSSADGDAVPRRAHRRAYARAWTGSSSPRASRPTRSFTAR